MIHVVVTSHASSRRIGTQRRLLLPLIAAALPLVALALYLRTAPQRAEQALRRASFSQLVAAIKRDPGNPRLLYYFGLRNRDLGRIGPARAALARAAELDPDSEEIAAARAAVERQAGNDEGTYAILSGLIKSHPSSAVGHWQMALFYAGHSDPQRAYQESIAVTRLKPRDAQAWRLAGAQALGFGDRALGESAFTQAVALDPRDWRSQFGLGEAYTDQDKNREALDAYRAAAAIAPNQPMVLARLGTAQLAVAASPQDLRAAATRLQQSIALDPSNALAQLSLGQAELRLGDFDAARTALAAAEAHASSLYNRRASLHAALLTLYSRLHDASDIRRETQLYRQARQYEQSLDLALSHLSTGTLRPDECLEVATRAARFGDRLVAARLYQQLLSNPRYAAQARAGLGALESAPQPADLAPAPQGDVHEADVGVLMADADALRTAREYSRAADAYTGILSRNRDSALAWAGLGVCERLAGKPAEAFAALSHALALQPSLPDAQFALAALYFDQGLPDEAARRLEALLQNSPPKAEYYNALADCQRSDPVTYARAEDNYRKAAEMDPAQPDYRVNLADMETLNNKLPDAERDYRDALQAAPGSAHARLALAQFLLREQATPDRQAEAERLLRSALAQQPASPKAQLALGQLLMTEGRTNEAIKPLEQAVLRAPTQQEGWYNLARAYGALHNGERSAYCYAAFKRISSLDEALDRALDYGRTHPRDAAAHLKLARLYSRAGVYTKALNQYQVALALGDEAAKTELDKLSAVLQTTGKMPDMSLFDRMVRASVKHH